jgi:hypothetical protein
MKTVNKQQTVILMLLVIPKTTLAIVMKTTTTELAFAKSGSSRGQTETRICYGDNIIQR